MSESSDRDKTKTFSYWDQIETKTGVRYTVIETKEELQNPNSPSSVSDQVQKVQSQE